jgi:hypothetical protein
MKIDKRKVLIISTERTGSSVLTEYIQTQLLLKGPVSEWQEPEVPGTSEGPAFWLGKLKEEIIDNKKDFVLKVHYRNLNEEMGYTKEMLDYLLNSDEVLRIRLYRRDVVSQIASYYTAATRNNYYWNFVNGDPDPRDILDIDMNQMIKRTEHILYWNNQLRKCSINFDFDLYYEDFPEIKSYETKWVVAPKPLNYNIIQESAEKAYELTMKRHYE